MKIRFGQAGYLPSQDLKAHGQFGIALLELVNDGTIKEIPIHPELRQALAEAPNTLYLSVEGMSDQVRNTIYATNGGDKKVIAIADKPQTLANNLSGHDGEQAAEKIRKLSKWG